MLIRYFYQKIVTMTFIKLVVMMVVVGLPGLVLSAPLDVGVEPTNLKYYSIINNSLTATIKCGELYLRTDNETDSSVMEIDFLKHQTAEMMTVGINFLIIQDIGWSKLTLFTQNKDSKLTQLSEPKVETIQSKVESCTTRSVSWHFNVSFVYVTSLVLVIETKTMNIFIGEPKLVVGLVSREPIHNAVTDYPKVSLPTESPKELLSSSWYSKTVVLIVTVIIITVLMAALLFITIRLQQEDRKGTKQFGSLI